MPPTLPIRFGAEPIFPWITSAASIVPEVVPSVTHNSFPCSPSSKVKKTLPLMEERLESGTPPYPKPISLNSRDFTALVPALVPSEVQMERRSFSSLALKNNFPLALIRGRGSESSLPGSMSFTNTVPVAVPSDFQSSLPLVSSRAVKKSVPSIFVK